jgi:hypothetical protein
LYVFALSSGTKVLSVLPVRHGVAGGVHGAGGLHLNLLEIAGLKSKLHERKYALGMIVSFSD